MLVASERDPVAAVVLHSSIRDIDTVIIDGIVRKEGGILQDVMVPHDIEPAQSSSGDRLRWDDVSAHVMALSRDISERKKFIDPKVAEVGVIEGLYMNGDARC